MYIEPVSASDLRAINPMSVVNDPACVDVDAFVDEFRDAAKAEDAKGNEARARAFRLLAVFSSFHFKPGDKIEPFSNMASFADGSRTLMGSDFEENLINALAEVISEIQLPPLRVRIADLVWSRDKSKTYCARLAVSGYAELVKSVLDGHGTLRYERSTPTGISVQNFLERAFVIARSLGWSRPDHDALKETFFSVLAKAINEGGYAQVRFGNLGLDYEVEGTIEALGNVAEDSQSACNRGEFHEAVALQELAIRILRRENNGEVPAEAKLALAKIYEKQADASNRSSLLQTHALQNAIDSLHGAKGVRDERQRLHDRLKDAQLHFADEMGSFGHSINISDEIDRLLKGYEDLDLLGCLRRLALTELPKEPEELLQNARDEAEKYPLSSLFSTAILDQRGRTVAKTADGFGDSEALRHKVIQHHGIAMGLAVSAAIAPAREHITSQFSIDEALLASLCQFSPFVPHGQESQVARGLQAFLYGDDIVSSSILIPFLESGLRTLVTNAGRADTTISLGGIEQAIGLGNLLSQHRDILEKVFGKNHIFAIENLFVHELGPKIRHDFCHGMSFDGAFYSSQYIYGCKLIFSLVMLPLMREEIWADVTGKIRAQFPWV